MNQRIKQLVEQATKTIPRDWNTVEDVQEFDKEKFAELIVRECAEVGTKFSMAHPEDIRYQIKRHFGVE